MQSHPLTQNPWSSDTDPEIGLVHLAPLHHIERTRHAIDAIARLVGNSACEPDATGAEPLDAWTVSALMGGVQSLCDHVGTLTDTLLEQVRAVGRDAERSLHDVPASLQ